MRYLNLLPTPIPFFIVLIFLTGSVFSQGVMISNDPAAPAPTALLETLGLGTGEGNILFTGEWKGAPGPAPVTGPGTRMMWYPDKAAFRTGRITGTQWDTESIGFYSTAFGFNPTASGWFSKVWGSVATATGSQSTAWGFNTVASGVSSTAWGENTTAPSFAETVFGYNNTVYTPSSATEWVATDRLFVIGNGISSSSDALVLLKNGRMGVGTSAPTQQLEVAGTILAQTSNFAIRGIKTGTGTFPGVWGDTESTSSNATGVRGNVTSTAPGSGSAGVHGRNFGTGGNGIGVKGTHDGGGWGVYGETVSGRGVYGFASATSGTTYGVYGRSNSADGVGVYGQNLSLYGAAGQFVGTTLGLKVSASGDNLEDAIALLVESKGAPIIANKYGGYFDVDNGFGYGYALWASSVGEFGTGGVFEGGLWAGRFFGDVSISGTLFGGSDVKLKRNINKIENIIEKLNQIQAYSYDYRTDEYAYMNLSKGLQFGFIAQELEQVFPELVKDIHNPGSSKIEEQKGVHYEAVDYKGINYIGMIPLLTAAINEQQQIIMAQQEMINDLIDRVSEIEQQKQK